MSAGTPVGNVKEGTAEFYKRKWFIQACDVAFGKDVEELKYRQICFKTGNCQ